MTVLSWRKLCAQIPVIWRPRLRTMNGLYFFAARLLPIKRHKTTNDFLANTHPKASWNCSPRTSFPHRRAALSRFRNSTQVRNCPGNKPPRMLRRPLAFLRIATLWKRYQVELRLKSKQRKAPQGRFFEVRNGGRGRNRTDVHGFACR